MKLFQPGNTLERNANYTISQISKLNAIDESLTSNMVVFNMSLQPECDEWLDWEKIEFVALPDHLKYLSDIYELFSLKTSPSYQYQLNQKS
jgi:hypothetical protein